MTVPIEFEGQVYEVSEETLRLAAAWNRAFLANIDRDNEETQEALTTSGEKFSDAVVREIGAVGSWSANKASRFLDELAVAGTDLGF